MLQNLETKTFETPKRSRDAYACVMEMLIEIRGKGLSFSSLDSEILFVWKQLQIPVEVILEIATQIADECHIENKPFPATLMPLDRRIRRFLKHVNNA